MKLDVIEPVHGVVRSHPSRGAWIEISAALAQLNDATVAPLTGCVD